MRVGVAARANSDQAHVTSAKKWLATFSKISSSLSPLSHPTFNTMADETMEQPAAASASTAVVADATPASADAAESTKAAAGGKKKGGLVRVS